MADKPSTVQTLTQMLPILGVVLSMGVAYGSLAHLNTRVDSIGKQVHAHNSRAGHPSLSTRVELHEQRLASGEKADEDQERERRESTRTQNGILLRLDAMCAAMPRCVPQGMK